MLNTNRVKEVFLNSLARSEENRQPYSHWLLSSVLPADVAGSIACLPFPPATNNRYSGKRNSEDDQRVYLNAEMNSRFPECSVLAEALDSADVRSALESRCRVDLSGSHLRIEFTQDTDGFWLEPHTDISVKKFTMLIYVSRDPQLYDAGTDIFDGDRQLVSTVPYSYNEGLIFIPSNDTWHGFRKRPIRGIRQSLIVNFVTDAWQDTWELVRPRAA